MRKDKHFNVEAPVLINIYIYIIVLYTRWMYECVCAASESQYNTARSVEVPIVIVPFTTVLLVDI